MGSRELKRCFNDLKLIFLAHRKNKNKVTEISLQSRGDFLHISGWLHLQQNGFIYMAEETKSVNTTQPAETETVVTPTIPTEQDYEAQIQALEKQKADAIVEAANWKVAALKNKKRKEEPVEDEDETTEDIMRRIANETLADSKLAEIAREQDEIIKKALKENKELKLAQLNKTGIPPATMGAHSESTPVTDTTVTPEQMAAFKAKGWSDKDIERYKKNLNRYAR